MRIETGAALANPGPINGAWVSATGNVSVRIAGCGTALCGDVVRVMGNRSMQSLAASRTPPPRIGLRIFSDLRPDGDAWRGRIFDRENGRTYDCRLRLLGGGRLEVRAYVFLPLFGQTQIWRTDPH